MTQARSGPISPENRAALLRDHRKLANHVVEKLTPTGLQIDRRPRKSAQSSESCFSVHLLPPLSHSPNWFPECSGVAPARPLLVSDGDCEFCGYWARYGHRASAADASFLVLSHAPG